MIYSFSAFKFQYIRLCIGISAELQFSPQMFSFCSLLELWSCILQLNCDLKSINSKATTYSKKQIISYPNLIIESVHYFLAFLFFFTSKVFFDVSIEALTYFHLITQYFVFLSVALIKFWTLKGTKTS